MKNVFGSYFLKKGVYVGFLIKWKNRVFEFIHFTNSDNIGEMELLIFT